MRILRLSSVFSPPEAALRRRDLDPVGGMQNHTGSLTRALDLRGVAQDVVTAYRPGAPLREALGSWSRVHRVGLPVATGRQCWSPAAAVLATALARDADVVHAHLGEDVAVLPIAAAAAALHRLPLVVTIHCSVRHTLVGGDRRARRVKAVGGPLEHWACRRADAVLVLTERLRGAVITGGVAADRVHVMPSGVRDECFDGPFADPFPGVPRPRFAFVGRLAAQKDPLTLVSAIARMRSGAHVVVVGDGPQADAVRERIHTLGIAGRVHLRGFVPHEQVPAVLAHCDGMVLPSRYEELGSALLEAMRAGVPIVASRTGGIPEVVHDGRSGLLVDPGDAAGFARALDRLAGDPALRDRLGAAGAARAADFSWDALAPRVLDVYRRVTGRPLLWGWRATTGRACMGVRPAGRPDREGERASRPAGAPPRSILSRP